LELLDQSPAIMIQPALEIDYEQYGEGEAKLAWLDQDIEIESPDEIANLGATRLMQKIYLRIMAGGYPIGHLKFLLNRKEKFSFTATSAVEVIPEYGPAGTSSLLLNARVQTEPEILSRLVSDAVAELEKRDRFRIRIRSDSSFQPGFPKPAYRME
jgi:hypothetical protein